jgi:hypothetical protein
MDENLKRELGNMIEVMLFQSGCTKTKRCDSQNPELDGYIVSHEKLEGLVKMVVQECANFVDSNTSVPCSGVADGWADGRMIWDHFEKEFD